MKRIISIVIVIGVLVCCCFSFPVSAETTETLVYSVEPDFMFDIVLSSNEGKNPMIFNYSWSLPFGTSGLSAATYALPTSVFYRNRSYKVVFRDPMNRCYFNYKPLSVSDSFVNRVTSYTGPLYVVTLVLPVPLSGNATTFNGLDIFEVVEHGWGHGGTTGTPSDMNHIYLFARTLWAPFGKPSVRPGGAYPCLFYRLPSQYCIWQRKSFSGCRRFRYPPGIVRKLD